MNVTHVQLKSAWTDPSNPATLTAGRAVTQNGLMDGETLGTI